MGKVAAGFILVAGLWVATEVYTQGPNNAFGGAFASLMNGEAVTRDSQTASRSTAQRAGDSVRRAQAQAEARRAQMLGE